MAYDKRNHDIPCPPPDSFYGGNPKIPTDGVLVNDCWSEAQPKGHLEGAYKDFIDSVWGIPEGRRSK